MTGLSTPQQVMERLREIDDDLARRQNLYEAAADAWTRAKRNKERARAITFLNATGTVAERNAIADREHALDGHEHEAEFVALKVFIGVLETRASIGQSILKAQSRS